VHTTVAAASKEDDDEDDDDDDDDDDEDAEDKEDTEADDESEAEASTEAESEEGGGEAEAPSPGGLTRAGAAAPKGSRRDDTDEYFQRPPADVGHDAFLCAEVQTVGLPTGKGCPTKDDVLGHLNCQEGFWLPKTKLREDLEALRATGNFSEVDVKARAPLEAAALRTLPRRAGVRRVENRCVSALHRRTRGCCLGRRQLARVRRIGLAQRCCAAWRKACLARVHTHVRFPHHRRRAGHPVHEGREEQEDARDLHVLRAHLPAAAVV
jgi:hypothetical protein